VRAFVGRIEVLYEDKSIAVHDRVAPGDWSLHLAHYVTLLKTKPGLLDSGKPFVKQAWTQSQQLFRNELEFRYQGDGTRRFIDIFLLAKKYDWKDVCRAIDECCKNHAFNEQAVLLELSRATDVPQSPTLDLSHHPQLHQTETGTRNLSCYDMVAEMLQSGVSPQSIWDALFVSSSELLMRQPAIVALHAVTTTNALAYTYRRVASPDLRLQLLLQNASFLGMFCQRVKSGKHRPDRVGDFVAASLPDDKSVALDQVVQAIAKDNDQSARNLLGLLERGPDMAREFIDRARHMVFLKGTDSHDYKFSSAIMEDYFNISPSVRAKYLAMSVFKLNGPSQQDTSLMPRLRACLES